MTGLDERVEVLVVDDSAVVRQVMAAVLSRDRRLRINAAADPIFAMEKMKRVRPDVIVLDIEMPRMDGVTFLKNPSSLLETKRQPYHAHFNMHRHPRISPAVYQVSITGPYSAKGL